MRDDVGALQRERPRHLREAQVVADLDADPAERRLADMALVARRGEAVDAEKREVRLAVGADQAVGADEHGRVAQRSPSRSSRPQTTCMPSRRAFALERLDRTGPGISSANGIASSRLSNM